MRRILLYIALVLAVVGCNPPKQTTLPTSETKETGVLKFAPVHISVQTEELLAPKAQTATRQQNNNAERDLADANKAPHVLTVTITDKQTGKIVEKYADHNTMPATVVLNAGTYTINARTADINNQLPLNGLVGFDQPQYGTTQEVEISSNEVTNVALNCRQTTAGVTVSYSDLFKQVYPCSVPGETYNVRIFSTYGGDILFTKEETRTAHYVIPTADMLLFYQVIIYRSNKEQTLINTHLGKETQFDPSSMPVRGACNYNLTIKVLEQ